MALYRMPALLLLLVTGCPAAITEPRGRVPVPALHVPGGASKLNVSQVVYLKRPAVHSRMVKAELP
jgi:hypothetical protein